MRLPACWCSTPAGRVSRFRFHADVGLHVEEPLVAILFHLRVALAQSVPGRIGRGDQRGVHTVDARGELTRWGCGAPCPRAFPAAFDPVSTEPVVLQDILILRQLALRFEDELGHIALRQRHAD